jgi:hypothetical protein
MSNNILLYSHPGGMDGVDRVLVHPPAALLLPMLPNGQAKKFTYPIFPIGLACTISNIGPGTKAGRTGHLKGKDYLPPVHLELTMLAKHLPAPIIRRLNTMKKYEVKCGTTTITFQIDETKFEEIIKIAEKQISTQEWEEALKGVNENPIYAFLVIISTILDFIIREVTADIEEAKKQLYGCMGWKKDDIDFGIQILNVEHQPHLIITELGE